MAQEKSAQEALASGAADPVIRAAVERLLGTWSFQREWRPPLRIVRGKGVYLFDHTGKRYLDFSSGLVCVNLGYGNERIVEAVKEQLEKLPYLVPSLATDIRAEAAEELSKIVPRPLGKFFVSTSGTEANEDALVIARTLQFPRYKVVARYRSFHGSTAASRSVTGDFRRIPVEIHSRAGDTVFVPDPYSYRCPFGEKDPEECALESLRVVEYVLKHEGNVAAILMETMTGTNGVIVPPRSYYKILKEVAEAHGVLLILDEVMTGWGRTGRWWAFEHYDIVPDLMTTAKGATSAYVPVGVTAVREDLASRFQNQFLPIGHTFAYHPLAMAAMKAVIQEMREKNIVEHAGRAGRHLGKRLEELAERHPSVGDVRGVGLLWAVELVRSRRKKTPLNEDWERLEGRPLAISRVVARMRELGVLVFAWTSHLMIAPPLIISEMEIDEGVAALDEALKIADREAEHE